jgi:hypothetical protein
MALQSTTALASITLQQTSASVLFSNIPQNYQDLILVSNMEQNTTADRQALLRPNGDSANASLVWLDGGPTSGSTNTLSMFYLGSGAADTPVLSVIQIMGYSSTSFHKQMLTRAGSGFNPVSLYAMRWTSNSAINSLTIVPTTGPSFSAGSTFDLYGRIA